MMKKSQILAAIALAMALGVVAPVVSAENASAAVVEGKTNQEYVDDQIKAIEDKFENVKVYDGNGVTTSYKEGYKYYGEADGVIDGAEGVISAAKKDAAKDLAGKAATADDAAEGAEAAFAVAIELGLMDDAAVAKIKATTGWGTDYDKTLELVNGVKAKLAAVKNEPKATTERVEKAENAVDALNADIKAASGEIDKDVAAKATDKTVTDAIAMVKALTNETVDAPETAAELKAIIAKIEGKLPQMAAYRRFQDVLDVYKDKNGLNGSVAGLTDRQVKEVVDALWAAYNGTNADKTIDQIANEANGVNAPATGIAGTAEGTATTVSIVAGLATALTALGAGVVAYRSARRK